MSACFRRRLRRLRHGRPWLGLVVAAAVVAPGACASAALAGAPAALTLSVSARPQHPAELTLVSRLHGTSGVGRRAIAFSVVSTEFGQPRDVPIGVAKTAADGTARIRYEPTWSGKEQFVARLVGPGAHLPVATASWRVTTSTPGPLAGAANPPRPLAAVGGVFLDVILTVVALVWVSLIAVLAVAFGRMPRLAGSRID